MSLSAGSFRGVMLGQRLPVARALMPASARGSVAGHVMPLDAPHAPLGVSYVPAEAHVLRGRGVSALFERGRLAILFVTDAHAVTLGGVRIGESLGDAQAHVSGLVCRTANEGVPACGGRSGSFTALFVGDPIRTITVSAIDTGWCFVRSDACHSTTRTVQIRAR